jgi:cytochrome b561
MTRYHPLLVVLHWLLAAMIIGGLIIGGQILAKMPNVDPGKIFALRVHMGAGAVILVLMLVRLVTRFVSSKPPHATTGNAILDRVGVWTHWALYGLVFLVIASGIGISAFAGLPDIVFFGSGAPLPATFDDLAPRAAHGILTKLLAALIALHIAAALYHQFGKRDGLFGRMWFGKRS